jgi:hypothetical protein
VVVVRRAVAVLRDVDVRAARPFSSAWSMRVQLPLMLALLAVCTNALKLGSWKWMWKPPDAGMPAPSRHSTPHRSGR